MKDYIKKMLRDSGINPDEDPVTIVEKLHQKRSSSAQSLPTEMKIGSQDILPSGEVQMGITLDTTNPVEAQIYTAIHQLAAKITPTSLPSAAACSIKLSQLIEEYSAEMIKAGRWTPRTAAENIGVYDTLLEVFGDIPISEITPKLAIQVRDTLDKLPSRRKTRPKYRNFSIDALVHMKIPDEDILSSKQRLKLMGWYFSLFKFAKENRRYISDNPFGGITITPKRSVTTTLVRDRFTNEELQKIFSHRTFTSVIPSCTWAPWKYWVPIIALHTGMRRDEIAALTVENIEEYDTNRYAISLSPSDLMKLKTNSSIRKIPVPPMLLQLGFHEFVKSCSANHGGRLFPELELRRGQLGRQVSQWFNLLCRKDLSFPPTKVFHSFRHTVADVLKQAHVPLHIAAAVLGHHHASMTYTTYGKQFLAESLEPIMQQLDFSTAMAQVVPHRWEGKQGGCRKYFR